MFKNYFKVAVRNLLKDKLYTLINILGLGISLTAGFIIFQYAFHEIGYDRYPDSDNIYRVTSYWNDAKTGDDRRAKTVPWSGPGAKELFPEIRKAGRYAPAHQFIGKKPIQFNETVMTPEQGYFADQDFLEIFSFEFVRGNAASAFTNPSNIVLTESFVKRYFRSPDEIMGKTVKIDVEKHLPQDVFKVSAIVKDPPANSHIKFDYLISFNTFPDGFDTGTYWWHWDYTYVYVLLKDGTDPVALGKKMSTERQKIFGKEMGEIKDKIDFVLQPVESIHLTSRLKDEASRNGDKTLVLSLIIIGIIILVIAYINYINLAVSKSFERAKEIGVRKTFGAERQELIKQFLVQAFLVNLVAVVMAVIISIVFAPFFESITEVDLSFNRENALILVAFLLGLTIIGSLISGFYPAFVLSSFDPVSVLSNKQGKLSGSALRRALVATQFILAMLVIAGTVAVYKQIMYIKDHDLGMTLDKVMVIEGPGMHKFYKKYQVFKSELLKYPGVQQISSTSSIPGEELGILKSKIYKKNGEKTNDIGIILIDEGYFETLGIKLLAGRTFDLSSTTDKPFIIINEAAADAIELGSPSQAINESVRWDFGYGHGGDTTRVIGVANNYYQQSVKSQQPPIIYLPRRFFNPIWTKQYFLVKYRDDSPGKMVDLIRTEWNKVFERDAFEYSLLTEEYNQQYKEEQRFGNISSVFAILAIVIASLGLYGLSSFIILKRAKEIAIRKVLAASNTVIMRLLVTD
ncbi:MAG TPA: ABC transporter permease, partial [Chitinophagaceae bacterium]|nr:ABC transporter permease [Chitinophagaceae bacterium]